MRDADYRENISKIILEQKIGNRFSNLMKSECPDWHNDKIGIEVTRAIVSDNAKLLSMHKKFDYKFKKNIPTKLLEVLGFDDNLIPGDNNLYMQKSSKVGSLAYVWDENVKDYRLVGIVDKGKTNDDTGDNIIAIIEDKLKKLNAHYTLYSENNMLILIDEFINYCPEIWNQITEDLVNKIQNLYRNTKSKHKFDFIYLFFYDSLIEVDTSDWSNASIDISQDDWNSIIKNQT